MDKTPYLSGFPLMDLHIWLQSHMGLCQWGPAALLWAVILPRGLLILTPRKKHISGDTCYSQQRAKTKPHQTITFGVPIPGMANATVTQSCLWSQVQIWPALEQGHTLPSGGCCTSQDSGGEMKTLIRVGQMIASAVSLAQNISRHLPSYFTFSLLIK